MTIKNHITNYLKHLENSGISIFKATVAVAPTLDPSL